MMMPDKSKLTLLCTVFAALWFAQHWMQASMVLHMAVQIPALVVLGGMLSVLLQQQHVRLTHWGKHYRTSLLLFALFTVGLWMLPRLLDNALHDPIVALLKWLSLPLAGMALMLSWRHLPFVLRGVLHLEALATLLRLGWLYLIAPQRYCVSYLLDEQQRLGYVLLGYGAAYAILIAVRVLFGWHQNPSHCTRSQAQT